MCGSLEWSVCVCVCVSSFSVCVCFCALVLGLSAVVHSRWEDRRGCPGGQLQGGGVIWKGVCRDNRSEVGGFSSRGGCIFPSPPTGCSSSAPGSGRGPLGRRPLSTLPSRSLFWRTSLFWKPAGTWGSPPPSSSEAGPSHPWLQLDVGLFYLTDAPVEAVALVQVSPVCRELRAGRTHGHTAGFVFLWGRRGGKQAECPQS